VSTLQSDEQNLIDQLHQAEQLMYQGEFEKAQQKIGALEQREDLSPSTHLQCSILKSAIQKNLGEYESSLLLAEKIVKDGKSLGNSIQTIDALIATAEALKGLGRYDKGLQALEQGELELKSLDPTQTSETVQRKAALLLQKGHIYAHKGDLTKAEEYNLQSLALFEEINHNQGIADALHNLGTIFAAKGNLDQAFEYTQRSLTLRDKLGYKFAIAMYLNNLGAISQDKGKLNQALDYHLRSLALKRQIGNKLHIAFSLGNLGEIYQQKGEFDQALDYLLQYLEIGKEIGNKRYIAGALAFLAEVYQQKGEFNQAWEYSQQSLVYAEEVGNNITITGALFQLVSLSIDMESLDQARQYLQHLKQISEKEENKVIKQRCQLAEALLLKTSSRARHRGKAEELLDQIVKEEVVTHELTVEALLNLCDLLVADLSKTGDPDILSEVHVLVNRLLIIARQQHSHWLLAEIYVLQAKLALVELEITKARQFFDQAQIIAEEQGLRRLAIQISTEHDELLTQLSQWEDLINRESSINERFELARLEDLLVGMIHKRINEITELPQEEPVLVLIIGAETGISIFSKLFTSRPVAEHLIGGFLAAINAFAREAFAVSGSIERIKHREYTILLKSVDSFLICYVFTGYSYFAMQKMEKFTDALQASTSVWEALQIAVKTGRIIRKEQMEVLITEHFVTH